ncbi:hypothetical protein FB645_005392 [Coemansia sp. IMI 203386]|nr:hypothetical protein FB645_005392 [Coemansia sp. IMI 203386]
MCCQDSHTSFVKTGTSADSLAHPVCSAAQWMCLQCGYASLSELEIYEHCRAFGHDFYDR